MAKVDILAADIWTEGYEVEDLMIYTRNHRAADFGFTRNAS